LVNDRFGHAMGDQVLRCFGDTVHGVLRRNDRVGRIGGEEFALLLPDTSHSAAFEIAERVRAAFVAAAHSFDGVELGVTVSVGVATARPDSTVQSILIAADEGLYEAKSRGRNRVERPPAKNGRDGKSHLNRVA
jgi:diguanylate cyclase (GGDEF)-like protein